MKARKSIWFATAGLIVLMAVALVVGCKSDSGGDNNNSGAKWTIMLYGAGNNDLDMANNGTSYIVQDVQDMEKVESDGNVNIIAMVSRYGGGGNARYYKVEYHPSENPNQISSPEIENLGTRDMSDPQTLRNFINYCKEHYPADRYQLIIDDHGAGWPGSCSDDLAGAGGLLTLPETREAITSSNLGHVDILTWHACLMGMAEVAYELRDVCEYMTCCQFVMPMENILGSDLWLGWLRNNQDASNENYARQIVQSVVARAQFKQKTTHYAMIKMSEMQALGAALGNFGNILVQEGGQYWGEVLNAWNSTHATNLDDPRYVDIREFTNQVQAQPTLSTINLINQNAVNVRNAINAAVPFTDTYFQSPTTPVPRGGLNVYIPWQLAQFAPDSVSYSSLQWRQTNWHAFVSTFVRSLGGGDPVGRCCYNNNNDCADVTQAQCATVSGVWTQGATCNDGCGGGGQCATTCATAMAYTPGNVVSSCSIAAQGGENWFSTTLGVGSWRFQLAAGGNDFDLYTFADDCATQYTECQGEEVGDEDFTCTVTGGSLPIRVVVYAYSGSGSYQFMISQVGATGGPADKVLQ
ncbi:MAG: hypothetical protein KDB65_09490 [Calditrichaeota bacterium]|nr:hypothetical protein [Calditrichota bacterium]MCB9369421.1 hypothetical protein [Calditrichota bacterium]